jgi:hypothetical protein
MRAFFATIAATVVIGAAALASAQMIDSGTVIRIDPQSSVVMLEDGRMYRVTPNTVFLVDNRPAHFTTLRPGERVVIQSGEPVVYREGRYIALQPAPVVAQAPPPPPAVVTQAPPPALTAAVPIGVRQTIYGTIEDVDRNGKIKIKTDRDSFEARVAPDTTRQIRKGDNVVIDLTISPPGSAFPR